jgi:HK97 family phage prohead protease
MKCELRFLSAADSPVTLDVREGKDPRVVGYAARYYDGTPGTQYQLWEGVVERIMPGAFDRAAKEDDVRGLFNHDPSLILGRTSAKTMSLTVDARGLKYDISPGDTTTGRDVREHLKRGDVTGSSFAFVTTDEEFRKEGGVTVREIRGVKLYDVGPVTFPAYEASSAGLRTVGGDDLSELRRRVAEQVTRLNHTPKLQAARLRLEEALTHTLK